MRGSIPLPPRSELDLRIDLRRHLLLFATTPSLKEAHARRLNDLLRERAAKLAAEIKAEKT